MKTSPSKIGFCDYVVAVLLGCFIMLWYTTSTFETYIQIQDLREKYYQGPIQLIVDPLSSVTMVAHKHLDLGASIHGTASESDSDDSSNGDDAADSDGDGDEFDSADPPQEDDAVEEMESDSSFEDDSDSTQRKLSFDNIISQVHPSNEYQENKAKLVEKGRQSVLQESILDWSLEQSRQLHPTSSDSDQHANFIFSWSADVNPSSLLDTSNMDEDEKEFYEKLELQLQGLEKELDGLERAATRSLEDHDDPDWSRTPEWLAKQNDILLNSIRLHHFKTLSGYELQSNDLILSDYDAALEPRVKRSMSRSGGKRHETSQVSQESNLLYNTDAVLELEKQVAFWAHPNDRTVLVFGNHNYMHRDLALYQQGFGVYGFSLVKHKREGALSSKMIESNQHAVLLCLALKNDDCFSTTGINKMARHQKINRIPGLRAVLWSKDSFCMTLSTGVKNTSPFVDYIFPCWILPEEWRTVRDYGTNNPDASFIVKPLTMGGGQGISVVDDVKELSKLRFQTHLVQTYLPDPHLIEGRKWDMRTYVLVSSASPMRAYVYHQGIARFATSLYDPEARHGGKKSQYLTNTSINKKYSHGNMTSITKTFQELSHALVERGESFDDLFEEIQMAISVSFLSAEFAWSKYFTKHSIDCPSCYQVLGVDLIVDSNMKPRVIEVNGQPSMQLDADVGSGYTHTKLALARDTVGILYSNESIAEPLANKLAQVDQQKLRSLGEKEMQYIIEHFREKRHMGGWKPVYPNKRYASEHSKFLEQQDKISPIRLALHDILMELDS